MFIIPVILDKKAHHKLKHHNKQTHLPADEMPKGMEIPTLCDYLEEKIISSRKEQNMASKSKEAREGQKEYWGNKLNQRLSFLADKGFDPGKIAKDAAVREIRAHIRETETRLKAIASAEKKVEEMARIKTEKAAAPKIEKGKKKKEVEKATEVGKRQQKKKKKQESKSKD